MIIYGTKPVNLLSKNSKNTTCPNCQTEGSITYHIYRKHAHIFWIPLFPLGKKGYSECSHCKNVLEPKEMPRNMQMELDIVKNEARGPIWQFAGLGIIAILFVWGGFASKQDKKMELQYLAAPAVNDVYEYKAEPGSYSTMKVVEVTSDSVFVAPNMYEISKMSKIYKIDKSENYSEDVYGISKIDLNKMYSDGKIFDINRD
ncbi:zinc-ribbon domain-containing protein [bacterium SCSIO 12643]|nr:zinc-ribbon domain-containing protein [bacterium SCSIO 12643]